MTKESLAAQLTGREYGNEITNAEDLAAKQAGLVVVFGYSDDNVEFRGAIHDEVGCCPGDGESRRFMVDAKGVIPTERDDDWSDEEMAAYFERKKDGHGWSVDAFWCKEPGYSWTFDTAIPHSTFEIVEDGKPFCRGIVFESAVLT